MHIAKAIERIDRYTKDLGEVALQNNSLVQDTVIRNIDIIGEARNNIAKHYPDFAAAHPDLPLAFAYQMRNALAHGYLTVDLEIVLRTIRSDLPKLHAQVQGMLTGLQNQNTERMEP